MASCFKSSKHEVDITVEENEEEIIEGRFIVQRPVFTEPNFSKHCPQTDYEGYAPVDEIKTELKKHFGNGKASLKKQLYNRLPCVKWLKDYRIQEYLLADLLAGLTVGIMHIPQGMAYSLLANLPPIYGLYTSFFPVIIYWIFASSRHNSMGTFAVVSLLTAATITKLEDKYVPPIGFNATKNELNRLSNLTSIDTTNFLSETNERAKVLIAMAMCFWIGVVHFLMFVFQLGFITQYLSEAFINSFTAGAAIHVFTSQMKFLFGIKLTGYVGAFKIIKTYINLFELIHKTNVASLIISIICITILLTIKIHVNERFQKKMPVPFPTELVIVLFGTIISYYTKLSEKYHINIIGDINPGLPKPELPPLSLINDMIGDVIITAIIAYTINYSLADIYARKHKYKINATQELLAGGLSNIFSSLFSCFPGGASLARSGVQDSAGGKTQLVSIVSSVLLLIVLLEISPLFKELPQACLASMVVAALKNLILQVKQLPFYWRTNKIEFFQFLLTFSSIVILDVDLGLYIGVGYYIISHLVRQTKPSSAVLGNIPGTELYKDVTLYKRAKEINGIKIVRIQESLHNTNAAIFKKKIYEFTQTKPQEYIAKKMKLQRKKQRETETKTSLVLKVVPKFIQNCFPSYFSKYKQTTANGHSNYTQANQNQKPIPRGSINETFELNEKVTVDKKRQENNDALKNIKISTIEENYAEIGNNQPEDEQERSETESQIANEDINENKSQIKNKSNALTRDDDDLSSDEEDYGVLEKPPYHHIIIDCSPLNYIDTFGVKTIYQLIKDYEELKVKVFLAECNDAIRNRFEAMKFELSKNDKYIPNSLLHLTIHDAVLHAIEDSKNEYNLLNGY